MARRFATGTLAMSEDNADRLVEMAWLIHTLTRATRSAVEGEAVPILLCDLFGGLAEGLMEELNEKRGPPGRKPSAHVPFRAGKHSGRAAERASCRLNSAGPFHPPSRPC